MERKENPRNSQRRTNQNTSRGRVPQSGYRGPHTSEERNGREGHRTSQRTPQGRQNPNNRKKSSVHSRRRKRRSMMRRVMTVLGAVLLVLVIGVGAYAGKLFSSMSNVAGVNIDKIENPNLSSDTVKNMKKYWTIAVFGVDAREGQGLGKGVHSDVIMVCNIERKTGEIKLVSIYRDTYAKISSKKYGKINEAYFQGGPEQAIQALNDNFDLQIDDYITFNWKAVIDAINILGGVDLEVTDKEFKYINSFITETVNETGVGSYQLKKAGMQHLDGVQAVAYSRLRLMDTDFQRTERQRKVIQLCMDKAKEADFAVLNNVLVTVLGQVASSFEVNDLVPLAQNVTKYKIGETTGFPFELKDMYVGKQDCVIPTTLSSNVSQLHNFLFAAENYVPSSSVESISASIEEKTTGTKKESSTKSSKKETQKQTEAVTKAAETKKESTTEAVESMEEDSLKETEKMSDEVKETVEKETKEKDEETGKESKEESEKDSLKETENSSETQKDSDSKKESAQNEDSMPQESKKPEKETSQDPVQEKPTEKPETSNSNIFTEKPTDLADDKEEPQGPGKVKGNAGVSAPGETRSAE